MQNNEGQIPEKAKEYCAVTVMRRMIEKYAQEHQMRFGDAMFRFAESPVYDALFDFETGLWREGPDYLMSIFEEGAIS